MNFSKILKNSPKQSENQRKEPQNSPKNRLGVLSLAYSEGRLCLLWLTLTSQLSCLSHCLLLESVVTALVVGTFVVVLTPNLVTAGRTSHVSSPTSSTKTKPTVTTRLMATCSKLGSVGFIVSSSFQLVSFLTEKFQTLLAGYRRLVDG